MGVLAELVGQGRVRLSRLRRPNGHAQRFGAPRRPRDSGFGRRAEPAAHQRVQGGRELALRPELLVIPFARGAAEGPRTAGAVLHSLLARQGLGGAATSKYTILRDFRSTVTWSSGVLAARPSVAG